MSSSCELCISAGGILLWEDALLRIVRVEDPAYVGFCRVILKQHVAEMSDLKPAEREHLMNVVYAVESALRTLYQPTKINLASLGNVVPHVHWHVIPRFQDDPHFPNPIWSTALRTGNIRPSVPDSQLQTLIIHALTTTA